MVQVDINEETMKELMDFSRATGKSVKDIIGDALEKYISEEIYTYGREKGSSKKAKGPPWEGKIPESEYKSEQH